jgi:hypothetical protein
MKLPDFTSKNVAVFTVIIMDVIFFMAAIATTIIPALSPLSAKMWELFVGANSLVLLALNVGSPNPAPGPKDTTTTTTTTVAKGDTVGADAPTGPKV